MYRPSPTATAAGGEGGRYEVADIVRAHGETYRRTCTLSPAQAAALRAIARCRTAALGGHVEACDACGARQVAYNSCRNLVQAGLSAIRPLRLPLPSQSLVRPDSGSNALACPRN